MVVNYLFCDSKLYVNVEGLCHFSFNFDEPKSQINIKGTQEKVYVDKVCEEFHIQDIAKRILKYIANNSLLKKENGYFNLDLIF